MGLRAFLRVPSPPAVAAGQMDYERAFDEARRAVETATGRRRGARVATQLYELRDPDDELVGLPAGVETATGCASPGSRIAAGVPLLLS